MPVDIMTGIQRGDNSRNKLAKPGDTHHVGVGEVKHLVDDNRRDHAETQYKEQAGEDEVPEFLGEPFWCHG